MEYSERSGGNGPNPSDDDSIVVIDGMGFIPKIFRRIAAKYWRKNTYKIVLTFRWLKNKIKEKMRQKNVSKVACADLQQLIAACDDMVPLGELADYADKGYTHVIASVDSMGRISDIDLIKDLSDPPDGEVERFLGPDGMVIVTR